MTKTFIVVTHEHVEGRYEVEAETAAEACEKFDAKTHLIDWTGVEQVDYMAYEIAIESVEDTDTGTSVDLPTRSLRLVKS